MQKLGKFLLREYIYLIGFRWNDLKNAVQGALTKRNLSIALKKEQVECVLSIVERRDVLAVLPTGYGKSLIFQLLPDIFDHLHHVEDSLVLVISRLNSL